MPNLINSYSLSSVIGIGTDTPNQNLTVVGGISGNALVYDRTGNSSQWNSTYTTLCATSGTFATKSFVQSNYLNLTGGSVNGNLTVTGNLSAQGTAFFANTIFTTTSALCAIANSTGPALYVSQAGSGDLASFYDLTPTVVEVLHVGASIGTPYVGVYTSNPNVELTVVGRISASQVIYASGGNSNLWNTSYASTTALNLSSSKWNSVYTLINTTTAATFNVNNLTTSGRAGIKNTPLYFDLDVNSTIGNSYGSLGVGSNQDVSIYPNNNLTLLPVGNVGIANSTPNEKLTVVGNISATNSIYVSALKITVAPSTFTNPVTASGTFLIVNVNGTNKAIQLWDYTS
jgi:hypothetical protein